MYNERLDAFEDSLPTESTYDVHLPAGAEGLTLLPNISEGNSKFKGNSYTPNGASVVGVAAGSAAAAITALRPGHVLVEVNGRPVYSAGEAQEFLRTATEAVRLRFHVPFAVDEDVAAAAMLPFAGASPTLRRVAVGGLSLLEWACVRWHGRVKLCA
jgi:hypothetical protein